MLLTKLPQPITNNLTKWCIKIEMKAKPMYLLYVRREHIMLYPRCVSVIPSISNFHVRCWTTFNLAQMLITSRQRAERKFQLAYPGVKSHMTMIHSVVTYIAQHCFNSSNNSLAFIVYTIQVYKNCWLCRKLEWSQKWSKLQYP